MNYEKLQFCLGEKSLTKKRSENVIVGGGIVGLSVAIGLLHSGVTVTVLDGADSDLRASQGNFGLIWVQGKGAHYAPYAIWTRKSAELWPEFAALLKVETGIDVALRQCGGYELFTDGAEWEDFSNDLINQKKILAGDFEFKKLDGAKMRQRFPSIGNGLVGATFSPHCGDVNPLRLLSAMRAYFIKLGGQLVSNFSVSEIEAKSDAFLLKEQQGRKITCNRVLLCAGLGAAYLGPQLGFTTNVSPQRGQLLITEKALPEFPILSSTIRQVDEGGLQIGGTKENVGPNDRETLPLVAKLARHAVDVFPALKDMRVIRSWGALRVKTPDGYPVYAQSPSYKNAFLITCHSGVTLAAAHTDLLAKWILDHSDGPDLEGFDETRFAV